MVRVSILGLLFLGACSGEDVPAPPVYVNSCLTCHGDGLGGAPITGDTEDWSRRVAKGLSTVHKNAIDGFEGTTGIMPAKGGRMDLSDEEIIALVNYMVAASR